MRGDKETTVFRSDDVGDFVALYAAQLFARAAQSAPVTRDEAALSRRSTTIFHARVDKETAAAACAGHAHAHIHASRTHYCTHYCGIPLCGLFQRYIRCSCVNGVFWWSSICPYFGCDLQIIENIWNTHTIFLYTNEYIPATRSEYIAGEWRPGTTRSWCR